MARQVQYPVLAALAICQKRKQLLLVNCCCWLVVILALLQMLLAVHESMSPSCSCSCHAMQKLCASGLAADSPALLVHAPALLVHVPAMLVHALDHAPRLCASGLAADAPALLVHALDHANLVVQWSDSIHAALAVLPDCLMLIQHLLLLLHLLQHHIVDVCAHIMLPRCQE